MVSPLPAANAIGWPEFKVCEATQYFKARFTIKYGAAQFRIGTRQFSLKLLARDWTLEESIASLVNNAHET